MFISDAFLVGSTLSLGVPQIEGMSPVTNFTWQEVQQQIRACSFLLSSVLSLYRTWAMKFVLLVFAVNFQTTHLFSWSYRHEMCFLYFFFFFWIECSCVLIFNSFELKRVVQMTGRQWELWSHHANLWLATLLNSSVEFLNAIDFIYAICDTIFLKYMPQVSFGSITIVVRKFLIKLYLHNEVCVKYCAL